MNTKHRYTIRLFSLMLACAALASRAGLFQPPRTDPTTGQFPAWSRVEGEAIRVYRPLPGAGNAKFVYLMAGDSYGGEFCESYLKAGLQ